MEKNRQETVQLRKEIPEKMVCRKTKGGARRKETENSKGKRGGKRAESQAPVEKKNSQGESIRSPLTKKKRVGIGTAKNPPKGKGLQEP